LSVIFYSRSKVYCSFATNRAALICVAVNVVSPSEVKAWMMPNSKLRQIPITMVGGR
jgi:hypothetical protein